MTTVSFRPGKTCRAWLVVAIVCTLNLQAADEAASYVLQNPSAKELAEPVGLADWPALAQALKAGKATQGRIVSFRELWLAKPGELSQPLSISGVVLRRFRRDPVGQFPALEELWLRTDDDNLVLVTNRARARDSEQVDTTAPGSAVATATAATPATAAWAAHWYAPNGLPTPGRTRWISRSTRGRRRRRRRSRSGR